MNFSINNPSNHKAWENSQFSHASRDRVNAPNGQWVDPTCTVGRKVAFCSRRIQWEWMMQCSAEASSNSSTAYEGSSSSRSRACACAYVHAASALLMSPAALLGCHERRIDGYVEDPLKAFVGDPAPF